MHHNQAGLKRLKKSLKILFFLMFFFFNFAQASDKVTLQLRWDHQFQFAGYYAADWQGFYELEGLQVTIKSAVLPTGIVSAVDEVGSGKADFGIGAADILIARDKGVPLVVLASIFQHSAASFYSKKNILIDRPSDFLKLRVARRVNDLIDVEFQAMLKAEGIDPSKVKPYPHQAGLDHLLQGKVDVIPGYLISTPFEARRNNLSLNSFSPIRQGIDFYGDSLFTTARVIKENPDLVERFTRASLKGWKYAMENGGSVAEKITQHLPRTAKMENLKAFNLYQREKIKDLLDFPEIELGHIHPGRWAKMHAYLKTVGVLKNTLDMDAFIFDPEKHKQIKTEKHQKIFKITLLAFILGLALVTSWVVLLRRNVKKRTKALSSLNEQLKESENRYDLAMQFTSDGLFEWNFVTDEIYYSPGWKRMLGYAPHEINNELSEWKKRVCPEDLKDTFQMLNDVREKKQARFEKEFQMRHKKGHWVDILSRANVVRDDQGNAVRCIGTNVDITERKTAEKALRQSMQTVHALLNSSTDPAFLIEPDGKIIILNNAMAERLGRPVEALVGKNCYAYLPSKLAAARKEQMEKVFSSGRPARFKDEREGRIFDNSVYPVLDSRGQGTILAVFARDITEETTAKNQLQASEEKFKNLFEQAPLSYQSLDENGNILEVNETWLQTMGYSKAEVIGKNFSAFLIPEWQQPFVENFSKLKSVGEVLGVEFEMMKKDGSCFLVSLTGKIAKDKNGFFERTHCVFHDISAQRRAEKKLRRELLLNKAVADISQEMLSKSFDIQKVSETSLKYARKITGSDHGLTSIIDKSTLEAVIHTATEVFGKGKREKAPKISLVLDDDGMYGGLLGHALNTRTAFFTNDPVHHPDYREVPDGHIPVRNYLAVPVLMEEQLLGLIAVANSDRDYTDNDLAALKRISELFALTVHRHAYETQRITMEQSLRQLQKNEVIGALAGGIAHDFNNILFPIVGFSEILVEDMPKDSPFRENVEEILVGARRAKELVKQILTFSRQTEQELKPLRPQLILKEVTKLIRSTLPSTIEVIQNIDNECRTIMADPTQIHQVAMNLITNAFHAMADSGGVLSITLKNIDLPDRHHHPALDAGPYILLSISDSGIGMNQQIQEKIFNPYFTTKLKDKGTGLGLSVVYGIVKNYKGDIQVKSAPGQGSVFNVYLPALKRTDLFEKSKEKKASPRGTEKILLVDDEIAVLRLEKLMIERLGYTVEMINSSKDALDKIVSFPDRYDLVITDMTMPKMTGEQLTQAIRNLPSALPIVICTGFSEKMSPERATAIGANGLLLKPVIKSKMAQTLRRVLDESRKDV